MSKEEKLYNLQNCRFPTLKILFTLLKVISAVLYQPQINWVLWINLELQERENLLK